GHRLDFIHQQRGNPRGSLNIASKTAGAPTTAAADAAGGSIVSFGPAFSPAFQQKNATNKVPMRRCDDASARQASGHNKQLSECSASSAIRQSTSPYLHQDGAIGRN
ncbi:unnamed protein product, partial [Ectocarpus fasciculatus]